MALSSIWRAWAPIPVLYAAYQLAGWIGGRLARPSADSLLLKLDRMLFSTNPGLWLTEHSPAPVLYLLDLFYLSYYVLLLAGPWLMLRLQGPSALRRLWIAVSLAFLICYVLFPWFPSTPPRTLFSEFAYGGGPQALNVWVLNRFSVGGNVFPSAHVAAGFSFAAVHLRYSRRLGVLFLVWALGIAISTVSGGHHYAIDAVAGAMVGLAASILVQFRRDLNAGGPAAAPSPEVRP